MGKVYSRLFKPFRTFNIENRAHRVIERAKPVPAPQYPFADKQREMVNKLYPDFMETQYKKNVQLDDNLKSVYVSSTDPETKPKKDDEVSTKPLPQDRGHPPTFEYGFYESHVIPQGKCSLKQALIFLTEHTENPTEHSVEKIALQYKLDKEIVANIVQHFRIPKLLDTSEQKAVAANKAGKL